MEVIASKICKVCKVDKDINLYGRSNRHSDGRLKACKGCLRDFNNKKATEYRILHRDKIIVRRRLKRTGLTYSLVVKRVIGAKDRICSICKITKPNNQFRPNKECRDGFSSNCVDCLSLKWQQKMSNPEAREKERARIRKLQWQKRQTPQGRIHVRMAHAVWRVLKREKKYRCWFNLVGYTAEELKCRLESKFTVGMTWDKFLQGEIHIDHIKPVSLFKFSQAEDIEFKECWALYNLQPLWAKDNLRKSNKYEYS